MKLKNFFDKMNFNWSHIIIYDKGNGTFVFFGNKSEFLINYSYFYMQYGNSQIVSIDWVENSVLLKWIEGGVLQIIIKGT